MIRIINLNDRVTVRLTREGIAVLKRAGVYWADALVYGEPYTDQLWSLIEALGPTMGMGNPNTIHGLAIEWDDADAVSPTLPPEPPPGFVRVRIAVAVEPGGKWCAAGWRDAADKDAEDTAVIDLDQGERMSWVTADVPLPDAAVEVVGAVEPS